MKIGSLFTGYGGLDMAVEQFFDAEAVWTCDIDPGASRIIAHRYPDIPNLGDITRIDWAAVEPIDILCAGWPCQPFSLAGKRKGALDERALWPEVTRAVRILRPRFVVLENVAAIATAGELARAVGDLSALGYDTQWTCVRAADVGAPHGRARIFILARDTASGHGWSEVGGVRVGSGQESPRRSGNGIAADPQGQRLKWGGDAWHGWTRPENGTVADTSGDGWREGRPEPTRLVGGSDAAECSTGTAADTEGNTWRISDRDIRTRQPHIAWGSYEPAIRRWESILGRLAPLPTETSLRGTQRLSPRFVEWMMGLPDRWVTDVPGLNRNSQLKALGNGVVPQQALAALEVMRETA